MRILYINNDGGGFADYVNVSEGQTVGQFFEKQMPGREPHDYLIRVNRQPVPRDTHANENRGSSVTTIRCACVQGHLSASRGQVPFVFGKDR